jgi:ribosomal protein S18 acetylase RimI-like enzyme
MVSPYVSSLIVTPFQRRHLQAARDLLFRSIFVHTHLDWYDTDSWLESNEARLRLAWQNGWLVGLLGVSRPLNQSSWIRLACVSDYANPEIVLASLWSELWLELREQGVTMVGLLAIHEWIRRYAPVMGFVYQEDIITLAHADDQLPDPPADPPAIRVVEMRDLDSLARLDGTAFSPPWQMSFAELRQAYRMASSCTLAYRGQAILGYQFSTLFFDGAHLARLAVAPEAQSQGVGTALLDDLLRRFARRGVHGITVNTQSSNTHSRRLYNRFGFQPNGFNLPYWLISL